MHILLNTWIIHIILIISIILKVSIDLGIADHLWQKMLAANTVDALGDRFKPELCAGWLTYIRETYPDGAIPAAPPLVSSVGEDSLVLPDWVIDALGLNAHWSTVVDVPIGQFSAMNTHPNCIFEFWKIEYNSKL